MVDPIIFLGAGANAPFCPDNRELLSSFTKKYPAYKPILDSAQETLKEFEFRVDLETVYTFLKASENPSQAIKQAGPVIAALLNSKSAIRSVAPPQEISSLLSDLEAYLVDTFFIDNASKFNDVKTFYDNLFLQQLKTYGLNITADQLTFLEIFTTNYDNVIETYTREKGVNFYAGYRPEAVGSDYVVFDMQEYHSAPAKLKLYKLHGSVTLYELKSKKIVRSQKKLMKGEEILGQEVVQNVMIFPVQEKYVTKEPYHALDS